MDKLAQPPGRCFCVTFHHLNAGCCSPQTHSSQIARGLHILVYRGAVSSSSSCDFNLLLVCLSLSQAAAFFSASLLLRVDGLYQPHGSQPCRNVGESWGMFYFTHCSTSGFALILVASRVMVCNHCTLACFLSSKGLGRTGRWHPACWVRTLNLT